MDDIELTGVKKTLSIVLQAKALDNRLPNPVLGDPYAERAMRGLDPDYDKRKRGTSQMGIIVAVKTKAHDGWARRFLAEHPDAVVLHLGCGLDARVFRVDPPASVEWYDLDLPDVIELRKRLLPPREHCTMVGSSVTDLDWLERVTHGRPVLVIAEGLLPYLTEADVKRLVTTIVDRFPAGQLQCDLVPRWVWRTSKYDPTLRKLDTEFSSGFKHPALLADWHPRLEYVDEANILDPTELAKAPRSVRIVYRLTFGLPFMRRSLRAVRYRF